MVDLLKAPQEALQSMLGRKNAPQYATRLFQLRDISSVMRSRLGWPVAAALMERWFKGAAYQMTKEMKFSEPPSRLIQLPAQHLDESTVMMEWALGFARVQAAMASLRSKWASPAGIAQLKDRVDRQSRGRQDQCWRLGNLALPAKILEDTCQVNYLSFGRWSDPMDDFYGAMGEAQMNVAVSGTVFPQGPGKAKVEIEELGFYLRDAYDFNDGGNFISQPLGCWGFSGVECGVSTRLNVPVDDAVVDEPPSTVQGYKYIVQNKDFRQWRGKNHRGGDFMVLSNVHRIRLAFPLKFQW
ncbi:DUF6402 family protein [Paracidovorax valerianellae]|uniref:Uncharacterized protein n=1 Tax=Paracidovorax valerianellae TaxID=187868 RepID=A0A1G6T1A6_9BURK|nr:DUF6402 family protein [Paracidovorax valerianellae]MDA8445456.1 DUF6402 family protein [Paracidovorax valerianellae]SDD22326.1 hypothetical protein SAMN05192589_10519 [Paracidovorax valerianellae]